MDVVPEGHAGVVTRLGRIRAETGPGPVSLLPLVDKLHLVDMRPQRIAVDPITAETMDGRSQAIRAQVAFQVFDASLTMTTTDSGGYLLALRNLWQVVARQTAGHGTLAELRAQREALGAAIAQTMEPVASQFGVRVVEVKLDFD